ncbi:uncharacterized protein CMC5_031600 [Chondromyces crocatus]|uniref:Uncharacterized protein n=1 Tax=Chondromyces crocatus TaxID=52 RepID=A0A0K1EDT5_CHOCO|nr:uncharacterized protein CMC5_031600 [Chondromyces crocatus]
MDHPASGGTLVVMIASSGLSVAGWPGSRGVPWNSYEWDESGEGGRHRQHGCMAFVNMNEFDWLWHDITVSARNAFSSRDDRTGGSRRHGAHARDPWLTRRTSTPLGKPSVSSSRMTGHLLQVRCHLLEVLRVVQQDVRLLLQDDRASPPGSPPPPGGLRRRPAGRPPPPRGRPGISSRLTPTSWRTSASSGRTSASSRWTTEHLLQVHRQLLEDIDVFLQEVGVTSFRRWVNSLKSLQPEGSAPAVQGWGRGCRSGNEGTRSLTMVRRSG